VIAIKRLAGVNRQIVLFITGLEASSSPGEMLKHETLNVERIADRVTISREGEPIQVIELTKRAFFKGNSNFLHLLSG
jgi:hypothetical protein